MDPLPIFRLGLRTLLERTGAFRVCGDVDAYAGALDAVRRHRPDMAIVAIQLREGDGIGAIRAIRARSPGTRVLVLSMHPEELFAERCLRAGASGYVMKTESLSMTISAIRRVLAGEIHLSPEAKDRILRVACRPEIRARTLSPASLSDRELQVFLLIGQGLSTKQIASQLRLSGKTIETHRERIKHKLQISCAAGLSAAAVAWALTYEQPVGLARRLS